MDGSLGGCGTIRAWITGSGCDVGVGSRVGSSEGGVHGGGG